MSDKPDIRWTPRRIAATVVHGVVGFLLGLTFTPLIMGMGGFFVSRLVGGWNVVAASVAVPCASLFAWLIVRHAPEESCRRHPAAPLGIALGFALVAGAEVHGAYTGGMQGLRHRYALTATEGIGILCAHCGYDLSGTPEKWPCPECGGTWRYKSREIPGG